MKSYAQFKNEQQNKVNNMPYVKYAFGERQLKEVFEGWGLSYPQDKNKVTAIWGIGDLIQVKDLPAFKEWMTEFDEKHEQEFQKLLKDDDFVKDMFMYELGNHEWQLTFDNEEVINACGLTIKEVQTDDRLYNLWVAAKAIYWQKCIDNDWF